MSEFTTRNEPLFDGDLGTTDADVRQVMTRLLMDRVFNGNKHLQLWQTLEQHEKLIRSRFHEFYIDIIISTEQRIAYKAQMTPSDDKHKPLKVLRSRRMSREFAAGVLTVYDRWHRARLANRATIKVTLRDFEEAFNSLLTGADRNRTARASNASAALEALHEADLIIGAKPSDGATEWEISPAVPVIYTADALHHMAEMLGGSSSEDDTDTEAGDAV